MKKYGLGLALSIGTGYLMSRLATFATDEVMKQQAKETVTQSVKHIGELLTDQTLFTTTSLNLLKHIIQHVPSTGLTGIHFEPQNYTIGQAIVLNVNVKIVGNDMAESPGDVK
ncbi:hypothetical protein GCM10012290_20320 [Halolactibacillus alkaliphilus]|uniref:Uncharacterized protein n=1 Tax=Halolactibacillus alkaliphilus TaxID=442899 RepID=A0A511X4R9_9BACI|nr:hypothetical protein [Halolactibacillus alkaliphilus]GEN57931.1 hypothetical protein HAL01_23950 [Halolactibacillus alkaliphilus]GGN73447.1 hypothetical protein GCM10012290_20320 [Halolactibacillus alkaliphilus]SFO97367.1 hypothetical protein SAMN05720591_12730 [Halolactibacillus alkaliphilus]